MLNSQPLGFFSPSQLVQDAKRHGVEVRPADVMHSDVDCTLEDLGPQLAVRLHLELHHEVAGLLDAGDGARDLDLLHLAVRDGVESQAAGAQDLGEVRSVL